MKNSPDTFLLKKTFDKDNRVGKRYLGCLLNYTRVPEWIVQECIFKEKNEMVLYILQVCFWKM